MRIRSTLILAFCGLALAPELSALPASAELEQLRQVGQASDRNAALDYWRLVNTSNHDPELPLLARELFNQMHPRDGSEEQPLDEPGTLMPGGEMESDLAELTDFFADLQRASKVPLCDFQVRYEDGYAAVLPHLGPLRNFARLLTVDARRHSLAGSEDLAAEQLATTLRLARHLAVDRILISSLVSASVVNMALKEAHWLLDFTGDARAIRLELGEALRRFPDDDPYNAVAALRTERDMVASLARQFRGPNAGDAFADMILPMGGDGDYDAIESELRSLNGDQFKAEVERAVDAFDLVFEAWESDDPQAELRTLGERFSDGEFGVVALVAVPAFGKALEQDAKARARLNALKERVRADG